MRGEIQLKFRHGDVGIRNPRKEPLRVFCGGCNGKRAHRHGYGDLRVENAVGEIPGPV